MKNKFYLISVLSLSMFTSSISISKEVSTSTIKTQSDFRNEISRYLIACKEDHLITKQLLLKHLTDFVFKVPGSDSYQKSLFYISDLAPTSPEPIYDLLRVMQNRWFVTFSSALKINSELIKNKNLNTQTTVKEGLIVGIIAWLISGAVLKTKPIFLPKYFALIRHLFPLAGAATGWAYGEIEALSQPLNAEIPPSPAHLVQIGESQDNKISKNNLMEWVPPLMGAYAGVVSATGLPKIIAGFKWFNQATTPFKVNLLYFLISVTAAITVEQGAQAGLDWWAFSSLKERVGACWPNLDQALNSGDDVLLFSATDRLIAESNFLTQYLNREFNNSLLGPMNLQWKGDWADLHDSSYETYLALDCLKKNFDDLSCYSIRGSSIATTVRAYRIGAKARLESLQQQLGGFLDETERKSLLTAYFNENLKNLDHSVALMLREGDIRRHPFRLQFQIAAFLRTTEKEYLLPQVDELMASLFKRNYVTQVLMQAYSTSTETVK